MTIFIEQMQIFSISSKVGGLELLPLLSAIGDSAWKVSKYGGFSGPNTGKYRSGKTPYLDTFHAVWLSLQVLSICKKLGEISTVINSMAYVTKNFIKKVTLKEEKVAGNKCHDKSENKLLQKEKVAKFTVYSHDIFFLWPFLPFKYLNNEDTLDKRFSRKQFYLLSNFALTFGKAFTLEKWSTNHERCGSLYFISDFF